MLRARSAVQAEQTLPAPVTRPMARRTYDGRVDQRFVGRLSVLFNQEATERLRAFRRVAVPFGSLHD